MATTRARIKKSSPPTRKANGSERAGSSTGSVEARAYEIWLEEGRPEGKALEHWLRAEEEISTKLAVSFGA